MITVLMNRGKQYGVIELPASEGKLREFHDSFDESRPGRIDVQYAGTGKLRSLDTLLLDIVYDRRPKIEELNALAYVVDRMDAQQQSDFAVDLWEYTGDMATPGMDAIVNKAYSTIYGEESPIWHEGGNVKQLIAFERKRLKPYPTMDKDTFWQMIADAREVSGGDYDVMQETLTERLLRMSPGEIVMYKDVNDEYVSLASREGIYNAGSELQYPGEQTGFGDDGFTDFRCWLIGQGKDVYMAAMKGPEVILAMDLKPRDDYYEWESFNYIASDAYTRATGEDLYAQPRVITPEDQGEIAVELEYGAANEQVQESELSQIMRDQGMTMSQGE